MSSDTSSLIYLFFLGRYCSFFNSNIVTDGFYVARTGLGPFGEGWEEKGEDVDWFLYNRLWGVGVFTLIEHIGLEPTEEVSLGFVPSLVPSARGEGRTGVPLSFVHGVDISASGLLFHRRRKSLGFRPIFLPLSRGK